MSFTNPTEKGRPVKIKEEGVILTNSVSSIDFTGPGVQGSALVDEVTETVGIGSGANTFTSTQTIAPTTDVSALKLKEAIPLPTSAILQVLNSVNSVKWNFFKTMLDGAGFPGETNQINGWNIKFDTGGTQNPTYQRNGLYFTLNPGYAGTALTNVLSFENLCLASGTKVWTFDNAFGLRAAGNRGIGGFSRPPNGVTNGATGPQIGGMHIAVGGTTGAGNHNFGDMGTACVSRPNTMNIGQIGVAFNNNATGASAYGLFAGLYNTTPTWGADITALLADNGSQPTFPIAIFRRAAINVARITPVGAYVQSPGALVNTTNTTKTTIHTVNFSLAQYGDGIYSVDAVTFAESSNTANWAGYKFNQMLKITAGAIALGNRSVVNTHEENSAWDAGIEASGNNLIFTGTGGFGENISWRVDVISINKK